MAGVRVITNPDLLTACEAVLAFVDAHANCICSRDKGAGHDADCPVPMVARAVREAKGGGS